MLAFKGDETDSPSEIVELPVIYNSSDNTISMVAPELKQLDKASLRDVATVMGGQVLYLKVRATYTIPEVQFCTHTNCYRPADKPTLTCGDHK